jgi:hypothetical protein
MKTLISAFIVICCSAIGFSQTTDAALSKVQKDLTKQLINNSLHIDGVKFNGCRVSLKSSGSSFWW